LLCFVQIDSGAGGFALNHISITPQTASSSMVALLAGDLTMLHVLQECFHGTQRIETFEHNLGIPRLQLTDSLSRLVHLRLLRRIPHRELASLHHYVPTEKAFGLHQIIRSLLRLKENTSPARPGRKPRLAVGARRTVFDGITVCPDCSVVLATEMKSRRTPPR
jgi:DNA-binding HxlR family transcriptional regulator